MINEMIVSLINSAQRGIHTNHRYEYQKKVKSQSCCDCNTID